MRLVQVSLSACLIAFAPMASPIFAEEATAEAALSAAALVRQLGSDSYALRERARNELQHREADVQAALEEGVRSPDLEVRFHCQSLLADIQVRAMQRRLENFIEDAASAETDDFPAWKQARDICGDTRESRQLYVDMYRAEPETLRLLASNADELGGHLEVRVKQLQRRPVDLFQAPLSAGHIAAMLLAAGASDTKLSPTGSSMIYSLCHQQIFRDFIQTESAAPAKKLLGHYVLQSDDAQAYQGMMLAMQFNLIEEGLACADKVFEGKTANTHHKQYAILTIAKLGDEKLIDRLKPLLEDKTVCSQQQINKVSYKTQLRDVALFAMIHLSKENPKEFGFDRFTSNPTMVANVHTLGFEDDAKRDAAHAAWQAFQTKRQAQASARIKE